MIHEEELILGWLQGTLSPDDQTRLEQAIGANPHLAHLLAAEASFESDLRAQSTTWICTITSRNSLFITVSITNKSAYRGSYFHHWWMAGFKLHQHPTASYTKADPNDGASQYALATRRRTITGT